jgi:CRISP-associated protein Cas1
LGLRVARFWRKGNGMQFHDTLYGTIKNGVCVLSGFVANVTVERGQLLIRDGIKGNVTERTFGKAHCPISRLVATQGHGYISLSAAQWLRDSGASFVQLDYNGSPIMTTVPRLSVTSAAMRRKHALLSPDRGMGYSIVRELIRAKCAMQIHSLEEGGFDAAARDEETIVARIANRAADLLAIEGNASAVYWNAFLGFTVRFGKRERVPDHWRVFGTRQSPLTGSPRAAVNPGNAVLSYLLNVAVSEIVVALHAAGIDPAMGILHADKDNRSSLAYDLIEPARPIIERWFFQWLRETTFAKRDFIEGLRGDVRIMHPLNSHLAMTSAVWRGIATALVDWFGNCLSTDRVRPLQLTANVDTASRGRAIRWRVGNGLQRPIPAVCANCGKALPPRKRKFCGTECMTAWHEGAPQRPSIAAIHRDRLNHTATASAKRSATTAANRSAEIAWRNRADWSASGDAALRDWYQVTLKDIVLQCRPSDIRDAMGCSLPAAIQVRNGELIPHVRHIEALAKLAGIAIPFPMLPQKEQSSDA